MAPVEVDVRGLAKPDRHPAIFAAYRNLAVAEALVVVTDHDPINLRPEFDLEYPESYSWEYLDTGPQRWLVQITKLSATPLPRVLVDTNALAQNPDATGAIWKLQMRDRDLDSNIIQLAPGGVIAAHQGPDLDVILHILTGSGLLTTELGTVDLQPGSLVWLPRRSHRQFTAGPEGLRYFTIHQRRQSLTLAPPGLR